MIFKIQTVLNGLIKTAYEAGMKQLNDFWGINWTEKTPDIYIVDSRSVINKLKGKETEGWLVGWAEIIDLQKYNLYLLDLDSLESESTHKKNEEKYSALVIHELCHLFVAKIQNRSMPVGPMWWNEGVSTFLSGQYKFKKRPERLEGFIESNRQNPTPAYEVGGFVIELLVNKFGKEKLIEMVKYLGNSTPETTFKEDFLAVYGFELSYEKINELYGIH